MYTVLNISKLKNQPQPNRKRFKMFRYFLRTLCITWSPVRRWDTRRFTRLKTMYNVLEYRKTWWNNDNISIYRKGEQPHRNRKIIKFDYAQYCTFDCNHFSAIKILGDIFWMKVLTVFIMATHTHYQLTIENIYMYKTIECDLDIDYWPPFGIRPCLPAGSYVFHEYTSFTHYNFVYYYAQE